MIVGEGYARRKQLKAGSTLKLEEVDYKVVGLARPPLGGQSADIYLPLKELQRLAGRPDRVNTLLVRADSAADVPALTRRSSGRFRGRR